MRKAICTLLVCLPLALSAQNNWERPQQTQNTDASAASTEYEYAKYLGNVVPVVNGEVVWEKTFNNQKSADENYATMLSFLTAMTTEEGQLKESTVSLVNKAEHKIVCHFEEWLVFKNALLSLDRTRFIYTLMAECDNNKVYVKVFRLNYWYEEERDGGERFKAEEWITDEWALNKKKTKLAKISGKFRRKTVDRMEQLFQQISNNLGAV